MKLTYNQIIQAANALQDIKDQKMSGDIIDPLFDNLKVLEDAFNTYQEKEQKLVQQYAKQEDGEIKWQENGQPQWEEPEKFFSEKMDIINREKEVDITKIEKDLINQELKLSLANRQALDFMLE